MHTYNPAANGAKWIPMRGTTSDLSPAEDVSAQELSNITIPDPPDDMRKLDHFGECWEGCEAEAPAETFCTGAALCKKEEEMEQALPAREEGDSESSEELEAEGEGSGERPAEEPAERSTEELIERSIEGPTEEPAKEAVEEPMIDHPTLGQESLPECSQEGEKEVIVHAPEDAIDCLC